MALIRERERQVEEAGTKQVMTIKTPRMVEL
jgi:hypothetical protein